MPGLFDLTGKRALVTGASRGIGRACAVGLANAGAQVTLMARASKDLDEATQECGRGTQAIVCDVNDLPAVREAVAPLPPFDILIANAGINIPKPFMNVTEEDYDTIFNLNCRSTFFLTQAVVGKMLDAGIKGSVIIMSSQMGQVGYPQRTAYCASKHGLEGFAKALAIDLGPSGIRVNTIAPGLVRTPFVKAFFDNPDVLAGYLKGVPLNRVCEPEEVAGAAVYLASAASAHMTGACIKLDGGVTAQ
jgi:NAD(P)-dependent dehydrogenase (short-subunit alcohol dehydrogenase family)